MGRYFYGYAINRYSRSPLDSCVRDLHGLERVLSRRYGFAVEDLTEHEVTAAAVRSSLRRIRQTRTPDDDVIVFFSGHGSEKHAWCVHGDLPNENAYIERDEIHAFAAGVRVRHLLLVSDSCFALGQAWKAERVRHEACLVDELERSPSRMFLAATGNYVAMDGGSSHSPFMGALLDELEDLSEPAPITVLFPRVRQRCHGAMTELSDKQVPHLRVIEDRFVGEFVFRPVVRPGPAPQIKPEAAPEPAPAPEPLMPPAEPDEEATPVRSLRRQYADESAFKKFCKAMRVEHLRACWGALGWESAGVSRPTLENHLDDYRGDLALLVTTLDQDGLERVADAFGIGHERMPYLEEIQTAILYELREDSTPAWEDLDTDRRGAFVQRLRKPELQQIYRALGSDWDTEQRVAELRVGLEEDLQGTAGMVVRHLDWDTLDRLVEQLGVTVRSDSVAAAEAALIRWLDP